MTIRQRTRWVKTLLWRVESIDKRLPNVPESARPYMKVERKETLELLAFIVSTEPDGIRQEAYKEAVPS